MRPNLLLKRRKSRRPAVFLLALVPAPAVAAGATLSAWGAYLFFAIVATVVIILLLHEALEDGAERDDARTTDGLGLPRYAAARNSHHHSADPSGHPSP